MIRNKDNDCMIKHTVSFERFNDPSKLFIYSRYAGIIIRQTFLEILKSASNLNDNLNCSKELEHYAS